MRHRSPRTSSDPFLASFPSFASCAAPLTLVALLAGCSQHGTAPSAPIEDSASLERIRESVDYEPYPEAPYSRIETYMGTGASYSGPDGLPPRQTPLSLPMDFSFGPDGRPYVVDWNNHKIRTVVGGLTFTVIGTGYLGDAQDGPAGECALNHPTHVSFDKNGNLYLAAWHNSKVMRMDLATEYIERICGDGSRSYGGDDGPAIDAILNLPVCVVPDPYGRIFISDQGNLRIRVIGADGVITTYAGNGIQGFSGDGGPAIDARFNFPRGQQGTPAAHFALDESGNMYVADTNNQRIRRIDAAGIITTVVGNGTRGFGGDNGPALDAALKDPTDVEIGPDGNLYIADTGNHCIRNVDLASGIITTFAGIGAVNGSSGDGGRPKNAKLNRPFGIGFDAAGNLYIADTLNNKIRVVYN